MNILSRIKSAALDAAERKAFIEQEITYTDAISGKRTAEFIFKVLGK